MCTLSAIKRNCDHFILEYFFSCRKKTADKELYIKFSSYLINKQYLLHKSKK